MAKNTKNACRMPKIAMYRKDAKCQRLMNSNSISPSCAGQIPVLKGSWPTILSFAPQIQVGLANISQFPLLSWARCRFLTP